MMGTNEAGSVACVASSNTHTGNEWPCVHTWAVIFVQVHEQWSDLTEQAHQQESGIANAIKNEAKAVGSDEAAKIGQSGSCV
jgi:hypothetical protein